MKKTYYWHDALHDDFANTDIQKVNIPADYQYYCHHPVYLFFETLIRGIAFPLIWLILKIGFLLKVKNREVLKQTKNGYFLYSNHTNYLLDAYEPSLVSFPKKAHIIVNADAVSIKGLRTLVKMFGAIPVPATIKGLIAFKKSVIEIANDQRVVSIYPEAHIWPFYTDIRPFWNPSFSYPVEANLPSFAVTNIYQQRKLKFIKYPKVTAYIDGPFYPDQNLPKKEQIEKLRNTVYEAMKKRVSENPRYNYCDYIYVENEADSNRKN